MRNIVLSLTLAAAIVTSAQSFAADPILIKFSHVLSPETPKGKGADRFKELAEKYTEGKVKVEVYPNSQLYKDKEETEALQLGAVQMLAPALSKFGPLGIKEFEAYDLPYLFADRTALRKVTEGPIGKAMLSKLEAKGIIGLGYWDNGFKQLTANQPLEKPEDLLGKKMRIPSSKVIGAQMTALGASPQVMAYSEVYQGLQTGVVDGTENTASNILTGKTHEVQKFLTVTNHGYLGYALIVNKQFWESIPAELRPALDKAIAEATAYANDIAENENEKALESIRASGKTKIIVPTEVQHKAWVAALKPVHDEMAGRIGKDLLESIYNATGSAMKK